MHSIRIYESTEDTTYHTEAIARDNQLYFSSNFLTSSLGLERKLLPNGNTGLCLGELCIPMVSRNGDDPVYLEGNQEYYSINYFLDALGSRYTWDREASLFLLDLQASGEQSPEQGETPVDFSLPTMDGQKVKLSDYRGQKVVLFAWASW